MNLPLKEKKKALVIVAHPDDETIWMGGCLMKHKNFDWTIFSLCRASDQDRAPKFKRVCNHYNAHGVITDLDDEEVLTLEESIPEIKKLLLDNVSFDDYDIIFTHGNNGEYGHERHIGIHLAVQELINEGLIRGQVFYFNYKNDIEGEHRVIDKGDSDIVIDLTGKELDEKKRIVSEMHGYPLDGIDVGYCTNPESFKLAV